MARFSPTEDSERNSLLNHVGSLSEESNLDIIKSGEGSITMVFHNEEGRDTTLGGYLTETSKGNGRSVLKKPGAGLAVGEQKLTTVSIGTRWGEAHGSRSFGSTAMQLGAGGAIPTGEATRVYMSGNAELRCGGRA